MHSGSAGRVLGFERFSREEARPTGSCVQTEYSSVDGEPVAFDADGRRTLARLRRNA
jgi:hypothetical protein